MKTPFATLRGSIALFGLSVLLSGCSANFNPTMSGGVAKAGPSIKGQILGGRQPITGAHIYLFRAGLVLPTVSDPGYGDAGVSVLDGPGVAGGGNTFTDSVGNYVLSGPTFGDFSITDDYSCSPNDQMYLLSIGGNPGVTPTGSDPTPNNSAAVLMVALGPCSSLSASTFIIMNELTTIVAVTALQQFMTDATHVSAPTSNQTGLQNAFATANLLINYNIGVPAGSTTTMTFSDSKVYTIGNGMSVCVNSDDYQQANGNTYCSDFFAASILNTPTTTTPTNTVTAMLNIAHYPGANPNGILALSPAQNQYGHVLATANDLALPYSYGSGLLQQATGISFDIDGGAYVNNCRYSCATTSQSPYQTDDIVHFPPAAQFSAINSIGDGTIYKPLGIALDTGSEIWNSDSTPSLNTFTRSGTVVHHITSGFTNPEGIAIDGNNEVYVADTGSSSVQVVNPDGTIANTLTANNGTDSLVAPVGIAVDPNGNIIVTDQGGGGNGGLVIFTPPVAPSTSYTSQIVKAVGYHPTAVAVDNSHNIWTINPDTAQVVEYTADLSTQHATSINHSYSVQGLTVDGSGQLLVPNCNQTCGGGSADSIFILDNSANLTAADSSVGYGLQDASLSNPVAIGIDLSGNAWVTNAASGAVTVFPGIAAPVVTPLAVAVENSKVGVRP
jgi:hypothetical protein